MNGKKPPPPVRMAAAARDLGIMAGTTAATGKMDLLDVTAEDAEAITRGRASLDGQLKATDPTLEARRKLARALYAEYFANDPRLTHATRSGMVAERLLAQSGIVVKAERIAKWIANPTPSNRGRPKKK